MTSDFSFQHTSLFFVQKGLPLLISIKIDTTLLHPRLYPLISESGPTHSVLNEEVQRLGTRVTLDLYLCVCVISCEDNLVYSTCSHSLLGSLSGSFPWRLGLR